MQERVVLITGASLGIGAATATAFAGRGWRVFGTSRTPTPREGVTMLPLDVRDAESASACIAEVERRAGRLDALVNNAGVMVFGVVEEVPLDAAHDLFETNFWGVARMVNAALPIFRRQHRGTIVNVGSIAGTTAVPMNGFYASTKHALAGYTEALRHEVRNLGVRVALVAPGDYLTGMWRAASIAPARIDDYGPLRARIMQAVRGMHAAARDPAPVATRILAVAESDAPRLHNPVGAWARALPRMKAWMPEPLFERGVRRRFVGDM